jgi:ubiquinone/menaquinone biosynthesis C-methylase UbiE
MVSEHNYPINGMKQQAIYKDLAKYYDLLYPDKDYKKESDKIRQIIKRYKKTGGNDLLELACGTGRHAQFLKRDFSVLATDINAGMLRVARKRIKGVVFGQADMVNLNLGKRFDVVLCLFSSIGYVRTYANLKKTLRNIARHLKTGGVVIIDPWRSKASFKTGSYLTTYDSERLKITVLALAKMRRNSSITDDHYLIAEKTKDIRYMVDRHEMGLFERKNTLRAMRDAGLRAIFLKNGLRTNRGSYVGIKK